MGVWTKEEKQLLIDNYPSMTTKELMILLNKTQGQIRGMKSLLGLKGKYNPLTEEEKHIIKSYYLDHPEEINLDFLSQKINRPKTSISRYAKKEGLTKSDRPLTEAAKEKDRNSHLEFTKTERYKTELYSKQCELLTYYAKHQHPQGMLGKHHSPEVCKRISDFQLQRSSQMTKKEKHDIAMRGVQTKKKNGTLNSTTSNAYSRTKGGKRKDLNNKYFRSAWEANIARVLNYLNIEWKYEIKRFVFDNVESEICSYQPDFYLPKLDKWIEVKGWMDKKSQLRLQYFKEQFPEEYRKLILIDESFYNLIRFKYFELENWEDKAKSQRSLKNNYYDKLDDKQKYFLEQVFLIIPKIDIEILG